jgi:hypothetical protein
MAALAQGAAVRIYEKSSFPRHKVCGEFLSPEIQPALESLGAWAEFQKSAPSSIRRVTLHFGRREKLWNLPDPAFGLSRYRLDQLLLDCAASRGAQIIRETFLSTGETEILAVGRKGAAPRGNRVFGFKAHFTGPVHDAVELFFSGKRAYAGVSAVEDGITNVCGLAPESVLADCGFDIDRFIADWPPLRDRLAPLARAMDWLTTGPLLFGLDCAPTRENQYRTGDALGFIDPFTGSGILAGVVTGGLAGTAAAHATPSSEYLRQCATVLGRQYLISRLARFAISSGLADEIARWLPGRFLFSLTRPHLL